MSGFLKIFKSHEPKEFGYIRDYVTGSLVKATKEERRRQFIERMLVDDFGYPRDLIGVDVDVVVDGKQLGKVDISIFKDTSVKDPVKNAFAFIMVRSVDLNYLKELLSATNAEYGLIYDYDSYVVLRKSFEKIEEVCRFPMYGEGFENFDKVMDKSILRPAAELGTLIDDIYRYISEVEGLRGSKLLDEFIKLLLLKLGDEVLEDYKSFAWVSNKEFIELNSGSISESFTSRLNTLVDKVRNIFIGVDVKPNVKDRTIIEFFRRLHGVSILRCNDVPKYESLHFIARKHMNVEKGEVLTPYPITDLMVRLINPSKDDLVLDPACGSGRLIAWAIRHVHRKYGFEIKELAKFVKNNVLCIDVDPGAIKLARIYIALYSGVLGNTLVADSLLPFDSLLDISRKASIPEHLLPSSGNFDVILTHPPFNVKDRVNSSSILSQYELGYKWSFDRKSSKWIKTSEVVKEQIIEVLFLERSFQMLKMYGRMAIILPEEVLTVGNLGYVRQWLIDNARVLATISIPQQAFIPYGIKTRSFLLLIQKVPKDELERLKSGEYKMLVANLEKVGYDAFGSPIYKRGKNGEILTDELGNPIIDTDVPLICEKFNEFKSSQGLTF